MANYSMWVLEYSYVADYHLSGIVYGAHNQGYRKLPYCYALIKGDDGVAMVDVGYNHKEYGKYLADKFGVKNWHSPRHVLAKCDVAPEDVQKVFVTHAHFDHFGNVGDFPNATFYVQEEEFSKWLWVMSLPQRMQWMMGAVDPADLIRATELARDGRLVLVNGDMENVMPGVDLYAAADTHTYGSQYVRVRNDGVNPSSDSWVFAGDLIYVYENLQGSEDMVGRKDAYIPVGLAVGSQTNLVLTTERMMGMVGHDVKRIVPVHEERLREAFPSRIGEDGLRVTEICLADGARSCVAA